MGNPSSSESDPKDSPLLQTKPEDLRVGMYVDLNCSWFKHPFASKTFKITSEKELAIILGLGLSTVLVDPALSDPERPEQGTANEADAGQDTPASLSSAAPQARPDSEGAPLRSTVTRYKESLQQADAVYKQTLAQSATVLREIGIGSEASLMAGKAMITNLAQLLLDDAASSAMGSLLSAQDLDDFHALHAMNVAVLSMLVGRQFDLSHEDMQSLGIAGLLHDIGEQQLPPHLKRARERNMTAEDRTVFQQHVDFGLSMLAKFPGLPDAVTDMILHHHERIDGSGYPCQLNGHQLPLPSQILMVVDEYENLINAPDVHDNMTPTEALSKLYRSAKTTFPEDVVVALVHVLSVYPPGTVVELNDKSVGLVVSINLRSRMRPLVILYDPAVEQDNPNIADLSNAPNLAIVRSIARNQLPQEISDYLNLTRWTGYFINSSMKALEEGGTE